MSAGAAPLDEAVRALYAAMQDVCTVDEMVVEVRRDGRVEVRATQGGMLRWHVHAEASHGMLTSLALEMRGSK